MKTLLLFFIASFCCTVSFSQTPAVSKYLKISGGSVLFGTGDVPGYGIYIEGCGNFLTKNNYLSKHIQLGGELFFQSGVDNPKVRNPDMSEFFKLTFKHYSLAGLNGKVNFYPFKRIVRGLNISVAVSAAYQNYSREVRAELRQLTDDFSMRMSELTYDNRFLLGYIISVGYDFFILRDKLLLGARYDFVNYNNGDFNAMLGGKIGFVF